MPATWRTHSSVGFCRLRYRPMHLPSERLPVHGSSDYHGTNKQTGIAACTTDPAQLERILQAGIGSEPFRD
jgi:hypothetical protein